SFALASPGLPHDGMRALPAQIASPLSDVRLGERVVAVRPDTGAAASEVVTEGSSLRARRVVVAADPVAGADLVDLPPPMMKGLVTWWFTAPEPPDHRALLAVDGRHGPGGGPP